MGSETESRTMSWLDAAWVPAIVTGVLFALYIGLRLELAYHRDPSGFITAGDRYCNPRVVPKNLRVLPSSDGYDGEFYYRLALNPFTSKPEEFGILLDWPAYRQQRIMYPLTVWALSLGGRPALVPWVMLSVNYVCVCLIAWLAGACVRSMGQHALWALGVSLFPGLLLSISRGLLEPMEICLVLAALLLVRRGANGRAALVLCAAVLTRETALLASVGLLAAALYPSRRRDWYLFLLPIALYGAWSMLLRYNWGEFSFHRGVESAARWPLYWLVEFMTRALQFQDFLSIIIFTELCVMIAFAVCVALSFRSAPELRNEKWVWLFYAALAAFLPNPVAGLDWGFMRSLSEFYVFGALIIIGSRFRAKAVILTWVAAVWWLVFMYKMDTV